MKYKIIVLAGCLLVSQISFSDSRPQPSIFKCVNNKGETFYNDKPCPVKDKETRMKAVKDPLSVAKQVKTRAQMTKPAKQPSFSQEKPKPKNTFDRSKIVLVDQLEGADKAIHEEIQRQERSQLFAGASDADERRAAMNDHYGNPPEGSRAPASSGVKTQKMTEAMLDAQMEKQIKRDKLRGSSN